MPVWLLPPAAASAGMFGAPAAAPFGQASPSGFGAAAPGMFGAAQQQQQQPAAAAPGTRQFAFAKVQDKVDEKPGQPACYFSSLSAMPQYSSKSHEELR